MKYIALYFVFIFATRQKNIEACTTNQFECNDGKCINAEYECDDNFECDDYSDELNCVVIPPCPEGQYKCNNGECTVAGARCNGIVECNDRSDEQNCGSSSLWEPTRISTYSENSSSIFLPLELHHTTVPDSAVELDSTEVAPKISISSPDKTVYATSSVHHVSSIVTIPTYSKFTEYTSFLDESFLSVDMSSVVQTPPLQSITTPFPVSLKMTVSSEDYLNSIFFVTNETLMKSQTATFVKELSSPVKFYSSICHTNIGSCISRWLSTFV